MDLLGNIKSKLNSIIPDEDTKSSHIRFVSPIPNINDKNNYDFFDFCSIRNQSDFINYYNIKNSDNSINRFFQDGQTVLNLLNGYKNNNSFMDNDNRLWEYITLLYYSRNIFTNNGLSFEYTNKENDIKSTSIDFEICMLLYIYASKQQDLVDNSSKKRETIKNNLTYLINAENCFDESFKIAKHCKNNLLLIPYDNCPEIENHYILKGKKRYVTNKKINGFGSNDNQEILIKNNPVSISDWIEDIGGLDIMYTRKIITSCQITEYYIKGLKKSGAEIPHSLIPELYSLISKKYDSIYNENGPLNDKKYKDENLKIYARLMKSYWIFKAHTYMFNAKNEKYTSYLQNDNNQKFIDSLVDEKGFFYENYRYENIIEPIYKKLIKFINNNNNGYDVFLKKTNNIFEKSKKYYDETRKYIENNSQINAMNKANYSKSDFYFSKCSDCNKDHFKNFTINFSTYTQNIIKKIASSHGIQYYLDFCNNNLEKLYHKSDINIVTNSNNNNTKSHHGNIAHYKDLYMKIREKLTEQIGNVNLDNASFAIGLLTERMEWIEFLLIYFLANKSSDVDKESIDILHQYLENLYEYIKNK
jgi:hypothetical protein